MYKLGTRVPVTDTSIAIYDGIMVNFYAFTITVVFYRSSVITVYNCLLTEVYTRYSTLNNYRVFMLRYNKTTNLLKWIDFS